MIWEIASFGDVATLNSVFNAISVIFQDGGFKAAGAAIALLAVVGSTAGSMLAGKGELPFGRLFCRYAFIYNGIFYTHKCINRESL